MASGAPVFKAGQHVQQVASPRRKGYVTAVQGSGWNARVTVSLTGWHPATFGVTQIVHI